MKFRLMLMTAVALVASVAHAQGQPPAQNPARPPEVKGGREQFSYSLGMMMGANLKKQAIENQIDQNMLIQGFRDAISQQGKTQLTEEQAVETIMRFQQQLDAAKAKESKAFLDQNKAKPGVQTTATGLQYKIVKNGTGPKPKATDTVVVVYRGVFPNGREFDSSNGKSFTIGVAEVIAGWQEALQMMPVGSKWQLFVPPDLAYGEQGQPPIGPNSALVFELELMNIAKPQTSSVPGQMPTR